MKDELTMLVNARLKLGTTMKYEYEICIAHSIERYKANAKE